MDELYIWILRHCIQWCLLCSLAGCGRTYSSLSNRRLIFFAEYYSLECLVPVSTRQPGKRRTDSRHFFLANACIYDTKYFGKARSSVSPKRKRPDKTEAERNAKVNKLVADKIEQAFDFV